MQNESFIKNLSKKLKGPDKRLMAKLVATALAGLMLTTATGCDGIVADTTSVVTKAPETTNELTPETADSFGANETSSETIAETDPVETQGSLNSGDQLTDINFVDVERIEATPEEKQYFEENKNMIYEGSSGGQIFDANFASKIANDYLSTNKYFNVFTQLKRYEQEYMKTIYPSGQYTDGNATCYNYYLSKFPNATKEEILKNTKIYTIFVEGNDIYVVLGASPDLTILQFEDENAVHTTMLKFENVDGNIIRDLQNISISRYRSTCQNVVSAHLIDSILNNYEYEVLTDSLVMNLAKKLELNDGSGHYFLALDMKNNLVYTFYQQEVYVTELNNIEELVSKYYDNDSKSLVFDNQYVNELNLGQYKKIEDKNLYMNFGGKVKLEENNLIYGN